jgi:putative ABC transport system permease protein
MFRYYLVLGLKSLRRAPVITALIVLILAVGIGASMTSLTMFLVLSGDPIPHKSDRLLVPQFDNGPMDGSYTAGEEPERQMTWTDVDQLLRDAKGLRQTAIYGIAPTIDPPGDTVQPFVEDGMATTRDYFAMFDVPLIAGSAWTAEQDARGADAVVIGEALARRVFDAEPAAVIGQRLTIDDRAYTITGVMGDWNPTPRFDRVNGSDATGRPEQLWLPLRNATSREWRNNGWTNCSGEVGPGYANFLKSECTWLQYWVELDSAGERAAYRDYLAAYVAEQKQLGRMQRPENNGLHNVREWLDYTGIVSNDTRMATWMAFGFLLVCLVNVVTLMLAKFTARAGEIGVRRALGATRAEVLQQSLIEAGVLGVVGALLGLGLTVLGLELINGRLTGAEDFYVMDPTLIGGTLLLGLVAALVAGLLPTWQACQVRPAIQLKSQ